ADRLGGDAGVGHSWEGADHQNCQCPCVRRRTLHAARSSPRLAVRESLSEPGRRCQPRGHRYPRPTDMSISTNQLKSGNHVEVDGTVYKVLEFQHVNPGKGAAFVRTKLRRASDGNVIDKTF